jgi:hypothetical protein
MPALSNSAAIDCVVFLVQRVPSIGSPATSSLRISSILAWIAPFFFRRYAATAHFANTPRINVTAEQLGPAFGNRMRIDPKQGGHPRIPAATDFQRLEAREQPSRPFIE